MVTPTFSATYFSKPKTDFVNALIPIYPVRGLKPLALVRVDRVFIDHQRRGFFKIGLLPLLAIEKLSIELCDTNEMAAALSSTHSQFKFGRGVPHVIEGRDFSILLPGNTNTILSARTVRLESEKEWKLSQGLISRPGTENLPFREATLIVSGADAGKVICKTKSKVVEISLLRADKTPQPPP